VTRRTLASVGIVGCLAIIGCSSDPADDTAATDATTAPVDSTAADTVDSTAADTAPSVSDARTVVDAFVADVLEGGSVDAMESLVAQDVDRLPAADGRDALIADLTVAAPVDFAVHAVVTQGDRVAVLFTRADDTVPGGRFEGLDVYTVTDSAITGLIQLTSTANSAIDLASRPPTETRPPATDDPDQTAANVALVGRFFAELFGNGDATAADRYVAENYLQHNPGVEPGRDGLKALVAATGPTSLDGLGSLGTIAQGEFVVNLSELPIAPDFLLVDLFRVDDGLLVEHWDFTPIGTTLQMPAAPGG
jgi:predicted SnoaL-like aldol condensation-catalyzing enzyme